MFERLTLRRPDGRGRGVRLIDLIMDDAERRGEAPRERVRAEYNRFPLRVVSDGDSSDDNGVEGRERREANHYGKVSTPMEVFLANADGPIREPFADLESALIAQGGRLVDPRHVLRFDSIGCAERYTYGGECERSRAEYCYVVMFLDRGDGFAMRAKYLTTTRSTPVLPLTSTMSPTSWRCRPTPTTQTERGWVGGAGSSIATL